VGLAVHNDEAVMHRARLCPQGPQARKPSLQKLYWNESGDWPVNGAKMIFLKPAIDA
jgi:hypothetical protein